MAAAIFAAGLPSVRVGAGDAAAIVGTGKAEPASPTVDEWLNQTVRVRETTPTRSEPTADSKPTGEVRSGAEVKAIGLVANKLWVRIELPDHTTAYLPRDAIEYESGGAPAAPATGSAHGGPGAPANGAPPSAANSTTAGHPAITSAAAPGAIRGKVARVPNSATLVVGDQRVRLSGIDPGPSEVLGPFENWVRAQGDIACEPDAQTGRYHCFTSGGVDVAEAAILNGAGRVGEGAAPEYRDSETQARNAKRGLWGEP